MGERMSARCCPGHGTMAHTSGCVNHPEYAPPVTADECTCPHGERPLGMLYGVNMGRGIVRLSTTKGCPVHDTCQGYTKAVRAARPEWSNPWCPIHATRNCPEISR